MFNHVGIEHSVNDVPGQQVEESPVTFHKRNAKKVGENFTSI
jgi:hypothetical protein